MRAGSEVRTEDLCSGCKLFLEHIGLVHVVAMELGEPIGLGEVHRGGRGEAVKEHGAVFIVLDFRPDLDDVFALEGAEEDRDRQVLHGVFQPDRGGDDVRVVWVGDGLHVVDDEFRRDIPVGVGHLQGRLQHVAVTERGIEVELVNHLVTATRIRKSVADDAVTALGEGSVVLDAEFHFRSVGRDDDLSRGRDSGRCQKKDGQAEDKVHDGTYWVLGGGRCFGIATG